MSTEGCDKAVKWCGETLPCVVEVHGHEGPCRIRVPGSDNMTYSAGKQMTEEQGKEALEREGVKYDAGKPMLGLFPFEALTEIGKVLTYGAKKYEAHNWRKGMAWSRYYDALLRHLNAWNSGEDIDPESGLMHLAHAGCCLVFLIASAVTGLGRDDRWRKP